MGGFLSLADGEIWLPIPIIRRPCDTLGHWEEEFGEFSGIYFHPVGIVGGHPWPRCHIRDSRLWGWRLHSEQNSYSDLRSQPRLADLQPLLNDYCQRSAANDWRRSNDGRDDRIHATRAGHRA